MRGPMLKRIALFIGLNLLIILTVSIISSVFHIQPYLNAHGLDIRSLAIFCLIWGMTGAFISLAVSRQIAKWMLGVSVIDPNTRDPQFKEILDTVASLAHRAGIPIPEVGFYKSNEVNAFATGPTKNRSLVAVSTGLLQKMHRHELEGVLGHEIAHIANGDMVTMTLLQGVVNAFVLFLSRILAYVISGFGKSRESNQSGGNYLSFVMLTYLFEVVFMALGFMLIAAYSRFREFRADRGGAELAGKSSMISALKALMAQKQVAEPQNQAQTIAALKISRSSKHGIMSLFSTHPPLEERIKKLEEL